MYLYTYLHQAAGSGVWVYAGSRTVVYRDRAEASALDGSQRALWANDRQLALRAANRGLRRLGTPT